MIDFSCKTVEFDKIIKCSLGLSKCDYEIFNYLSKNTTKDYTSNDIKSKLNLDLTTIQRSLKKLTEKDIICRTKKNLQNGGFTYFYKLNNKNTIKQDIYKNIDYWTNKLKQKIENW